jgi:hypothetical protein
MSFPSSGQLVMPGHRFDRCGGLRDKGQDTAPSKWWENNLQPSKTVIIARTFSPHYCLPVAKATQTFDGQPALA